MKRISIEEIDNYIVDHTSDPSAVTAEIGNVLLRQALDLNLTKKQKCYIMMYYMKGMTMQEIAESCKVNRSTVSRTIALARKQIAGGISSAALRKLLVPSGGDAEN